MSSINGKQFSNPKNVNLKGGILRFGTTNSSTPFESTANGFYINSSNQLVYSAQGVTATLGPVGSFNQSSTTGAAPALTLTQADTDYAFITFIGTSGSASQSISTADKTSGGTVKYVKCLIGSTVHWIQVYENS